LTLALDLTIFLLLDLAHAAMIYIFPTFSRTAFSPARSYTRWASTLSIVAASIFCSQAQQGASNGQWASYGGDLGSTKYSNLSQVRADNLNDLKVAWEWSSPENERVKANRTNPLLRTIRYEATPLMVDGTLYTSSSHSDVIAINCETGKTIWSYDPETWKKGRVSGRTRQVPGSKK